MGDKRTPLLGGALQRMNAVPATQTAKQPKGQRSHQSTYFPFFFFFFGFSEEALLLPVAPTATVRAEGLGDTGGGGGTKPCGATPPQPHT